MCTGDSGVRSAGMSLGAMNRSRPSGDAGTCAPQGGTHVARLRLSDLMCNISSILRAAILFPYQRFGLCFDSSIRDIGLCIEASDSTSLNSRPAFDGMRLFRSV